MAIYSDNFNQCFNYIINFNETSLCLYKDKICEMVRKKNKIINECLKKKIGKRDFRRIRNEERTRNFKWIKIIKSNKTYKRNFWEIKKAERE